MLYDAWSFDLTTVICPVHIWHSIHTSGHGITLSRAKEILAQVASAVAHART